MLPTALATSIESSLPVATETAKRKLDFPLPSPPTTLPHELVAKLIQRGDKKSVRMPNEFFIYRTAIVKELKLRGERIKMTEKNPTIEFIFSSLVPSSVPTQNQNQTPTIAFINELVKSQNYQPSNTNPSISIPPYNILQEHHEPQFASNLNQFSSPRSFMTASATQPINQSQDVVQAYTDMLHDFYQYQLQQQYFQNIVSNETFSNTLPLASSNESDNPAIIENGSDLRYILFE
ncbi:6436_t:CDS:2 [Ambispora gerdemannii]|uniref:6436_t:CDS:1 n=1 Tax=Ambispora gerdemannii TaxID=144530 RepID=A0A9N9AUT5_9GLOM|nr:6436_t:CDS:2 [Ambispora gerdemannii]